MQRGLAGYEALVGWVNEEESFIYGDMRISMEEALHAWTATLEKVFPTRATENKDEVKTGLYKADNIYVCKNKVAKPTVFIPVFRELTASTTVQMRLSVQVPIPSLRYSKT